MMTNPRAPSLDERAARIARRQTLLSASLDAVATSGHNTAVADAEMDSLIR